MAADSGTLYAQLSSLSFSDFTPSRVTRISSNPYLQQHDPLLNRCGIILNQRTPPSRVRLQSATPLKGKYIEVDFSGKRKRSQSATGNVEAVVGQDFYITIRCPHSNLEPSPTSEIESYQDAFRPRLRAFGSEDHLNYDSMERSTSFSVAIDENPILFDNLSSPLQQASSQTELTLLSSRPPSRLLLPKPSKWKKQTEKIPIMTGGSSHQEDINISDHHYLLSLSCTDDRPDLTTCNPTPLSRHHQRTSLPDSLSSSSLSSSSSPPPSHSILTTKQSPLLYGKRTIKEDSHPARLRSISINNPTTTNYSNSTENLLAFRASPTLDSRKFNKSRASSSSNPNLSDISSDRCSSNTVLHKSLEHHPTFLLSNAGQEMGHFNVSYLGSREIDRYVGCIDECARQIIDPKLPFKLIDVIVYVTSEKIRLVPPKFGPLFKSFSVSEIMSVSQCSKNKRLVGVVIWKPKSIPMCHLFRCSDHLLSNALMETITDVHQNYEKTALSKIDDPNLNEDPLNQRFSLSSSGSEGDMTSSLDSPVPPSDKLESFSAVYVGHIKASKHQNVSEVIQKMLIELRPSNSKEIIVQTSLSQVQFIDTSCDEIYCCHDTSLIQAIGIFPDDWRYIGYIMKESTKLLTGHVLWCNNTENVISLVSYLRQACQFSYQNRSKVDPTINDFDGPDSSTTSHSIMSRLLSFKKSKRSSSVSHNSSPFQSYLGSPRMIPSHLDVPRKKKDVVVVPTTLAEFSEEDFEKFSVNYVGTANLVGPFSSDSIVQALEAFQEGGVSAGMATVTKNCVSMHISLLGINLSDKNHKMFVSRHYPRKQILGFGQHAVSDGVYLGFGTYRPGFADQIKVHVFYDTSQQIVNQIIDGIQYWLQINPST